MLPGALQALGRGSEEVHLPGEIARKEMKDFDLRRPTGWWLRKSWSRKPCRWLSCLREHQIIRLFAHAIVFRVMGSSRFTWVRIAA